MKQTERADLSAIADDLRDVKVHLHNGGKDAGIPATRAAELGARLEAISEALDGMIVSGTPADSAPSVADVGDDDESGE